MSGHVNAYLRCDGLDPSTDSPTGYRSCDARVEGGERPDGSWFFPRTVAQARKEAKARGWTFVRDARLRMLDKDLCPDHKPQES